MEIEQRVKRLLSKVFGIITLVFLCITIIGEVMVRRFHDQGAGMAECLGPANYCARLHPAGAALGVGSALAMIGTIGTIVGIICTIVALVTHTKDASVNQNRQQ